MTSTFGSSFGGAAKGNNGRFSLLLLDENEYFFEDHSAVYYHPRPNQRGMSIQQRQATPIQGRLKVCSMSLVFDPDNFRHPVMRLPLANVSKLKTIDSGERFYVKTTQVIEMKENNTNHPYYFKDLNDEPDDTEGYFLFSFNFSNLTKVLRLVDELVSISKMVSKSARDARVEQLIDRGESRESFDTSRFSDIREQPQLEQAVLAHMITPLVETPGLVMITESRFYFQPFNDIAAVPVFKYDISAIRSIYKRRFIMSHCGMELLFKEDSSLADSSLFLTFHSKEVRDHVYNVLASQAQLRLNPESSLEIMQQKWMSRKISNFEYLTFLNQQAGRSLNDLTQYPVFPWVIKDYQSRTLDLEDPATFRDLSKPIGALNEERLKALRSRFEQMPDTPECPRFMYGSHYSTPGYILYFLVRVAPEYQLRLQCGKFDSADRLFSSVARCWASVLKSHSDVKELIPEFYGGGCTSTSGRFLENVNSLDLGIRQDGSEVDDVELPRWASNPKDFIKKCREALECDHVSEHIHEWIDLIFGFKQKGEEAAKADNLFFYLTYEGAVDMDNIHDPVKKAAYRSQIMEFGQTPTQLFTRPHPPRGADISTFPNELHEAKVEAPTPRSGGLYSLNPFAAFSKRRNSSRNSQTSASSSDHRRSSGRGTPTSSYVRDDDDDELVLDGDAFRRGIPPAGSGRSTVNGPMSSPPAPEPAPDLSGANSDSHAQQVADKKKSSQSYSGFRSFGKADFSRFFQSTGVVFRSLTSPRTAQPPPQASPSSMPNPRSAAKRSSRTAATSPGPNHPQVLSSRSNGSAYSSGPPSQRSTSSTASRERPPPPSSTPPIQAQQRAQSHQTRSELLSLEQPLVSKSISLPAESTSSKIPDSHPSETHRSSTSGLMSAASMPSSNSRLSFSASQDDISKELAKYGVVAPIPAKQTLLTSTTQSGVSKDVTAEIFGTQSRSESPSLVNVPRKSQSSREPAAAAAAAAVDATTTATAAAAVAGTSPLAHVQLPEGIDFKPVPADQPLGGSGSGPRTSNATDSSGGKRPSQAGIAFGKLRFPKDYGTRHFRNESLNLHKEAISALCISQDGTTLYSGDRGSNLTIYSVNTKQTRRQTRINDFPISAIRVLLGTSGGTAVLGSMGHSLSLYSVDGDKVVQELSHAHGDAVSCLEEMRDGSSHFMASGSWDTTVKIWQCRESALSTQPVSVFSENDAEVKCVAVHQNLVVSGADDGSHCVWDVRQKRVTREIPDAHDDTVTSAKFRPDGRQLVSCSAEGVIKYFDVASGRTITSLHSDERLSCLETDGTWVLTSGELGEIRFWHAATGKEVRRLPCPLPDPITSFVVSQTGRVIASGSSERSPDNLALFHVN